MIEDSAPFSLPLSPTRHRTPHIAALCILFITYRVHLYRLFTYIAIARDSSRKEREKMRALLVIDMQNDFITGSLAVPHSEDIIEPIINLIKHKSWDSIIFTRDWHPGDHISFAETHHKENFSNIRYKDPETQNKEIISKLWPKHCVRGTNGAQLSAILQKFIDDNDNNPIDQDKLPIKIINKGIFSNREYYSAFNDIWERDYTELHTLLQKQEITEVYIVGVATDYCVLQTAVSAKRLGYQTNVIENLTRPVDPKFTLSNILTPSFLNELTTKSSDTSDREGVLRICTVEEI